MDMITQTSKLSAAIALASALAACGGGSGGGSSAPGPVDPGPSTPQLNLSGTAVKGILANATVVAYTLDKSKELLRTTTDADGLYSLQGIETSGPVLVELTTNANTIATCDSAIGCGNEIKFGDTYAFNDSAFKLTAVLPAASAAQDQKLMITPLTHLAAQRIAQQGLSSAADIQSAVSATAALFGLDGIDINTLTPVDITDPAAAASAGKEAQLYASLVASVATLAAQNDQRSVADIINELAQDYATDGGLTANSNNEDKLTLSQIFEQSIAVVEAAEEKAAQENVQLDMDFAETSLQTSGQQADAQQPDSEITEIVEPTEEEKQANAVAKGISLLEDLNTWEDSLRTVEDQSLTQPFVDQLENADGLLTALDDQSQLLRNAYQLIGTSVTEEVCYYENRGECLDSGTETNFEAGPAINAAELMVKLGKLTVFVDDLIPIITQPYVYDLAQAIKHGYNADDFDFLTSASTNMQIEVVPIFDGSGKRRFNYTYTLLSESDSETMNASLLRNEKDDNLSASYRVTALTVDYDDLEDASKSFDIQNTSGSVSMVFDTAELRSAFIADLRSGVTPSIIGTNDFAINLTTQTTTADTTADLNINISAQQSELPNSDRISASIGLNMADSVSEESISGTFTVGADLDASEQSLNDVLVHTVFAKAAQAEFSGELDLAANGTQAQFQGDITADVTLLSATNVEQNPQFDKADAVFDGNFSVSNNGDVLGFNGTISATMESVKTPGGTPFKLNGEKEYFLTRAGFVGSLDASNQDGEVALDVNMAIVADIAGLTIDQPELPAAGDVIAQLNYGFEVIDADNVRYSIKRSEAIQQALNNLNNDDVVATVSKHSDSNDYVASFQRLNCALASDESGHFCDIKKISSERTNFSVPANASPQEIDDALANNLQDNPDFQSQLQQPVSALPLEASAAIASCEGTDCTVSKIYSGSFEFPAAIKDANNRNYYLRAQALLDLQERSAEYSVSDCNSEFSTTTCTLTRTTTDNVWVENQWSLETKTIIAAGEFKHFARYSGLSNCQPSANPGNHTCELNLSSDTQYVYSAEVAGATSAERIANLISAGLLSDPLNDAALEDAIIENNYYDNGTGSFNADYTFAERATVIELPTEALGTYGDGIYWPSYQTERYLAGLYGTSSDRTITNIDCSQDEYNCAVTYQMTTPYYFSEEPLSDEEIIAIHLGEQNYDFNPLIDDSCTVDDSICDFQVIRSVNPTLPSNVAAEHAESIAISLATTPAKAFSQGNNSLLDCYYNSYEGANYCDVVYEVTTNSLVQFFPNGTDLVGSLVADFSGFGLPWGAGMWAEFETNFGSLDTYTYSYFSSPEDHFSETLYHSVNIKVDNFYNEFVLTDFETEDAYIDLSAHLVIDASVTGLEDAQIGIFAERLAQEEAEARITLSYGPRTVVVELDSLAAFDNGEENKITLANANAEMTIIANCITDETSEDVTSCESGFNFEGDIFVDGYKVADLEDRDGIPVFKFDDGSDYELVVTPNFIVNEL